MQAINNPSLLTGKVVPREKVHPLLFRKPRHVNQQLKNKLEYTQVGKDCGLRPTVS